MCRAFNRDSQKRGWGVAPTVTADGVVSTMGADRFGSYCSNTATMLHASGPNAAAAAGAGVGAGAAASASASATSTSTATIGRTEGGGGASAFAASTAAAAGKHAQQSCSGDHDTYAPTRVREVPMLDLEHECEQVSIHIEF